MSHPLRENLELVSANGDESICCGKCQHRYCRAGEDWRVFAAVRVSPPSQAGRFFGDLDGTYLLRQLFCPSCAALVESDFIEADSAVQPKP